MQSNFFKLSKAQQKSILSGAEGKLSLPAFLLEKDIWICWVLRELFSLPKKMAFKGGTSLSKGYDLISRFSEDVDITIDYRELLSEEIDISQPKSISALKKISDDLKKHTKKYVTNTIRPHIEQSLQRHFLDEHFEIEVSENGEEFKVFYPSLFKSENYVRNHVLIEFGGRNSAEPNESKLITTFLSQATSDLGLPAAQVNILLPVRTFWEKATLIHVECHRGRLKESPNRLFRHWYDLAMLIEAGIGKEALMDNKLFKEVIRHKKAFYNATYAHYDYCLAGKFLLTPNQDELKELKKDFIKMKDAGMFSEEPMPFQNIIDMLEEFEDQVNRCWASLCDLPGFL